MSGSCLQFDVGNSSAKWRLVERGDVLARGKYLAGDAASWRDLVTAVDCPERIWISSVAAADADSALEALLVSQWGVKPWFARSEGRTAGLVNSYDEPGKMGVDRWLAMLGARQRIKDRLCIVDAGSALTIDLVSAGGEHEGGYIIPGPELMERALLLDTERVRFARATDYRLRPGASTAEAVRHGIALSQVGAVALAIDQADTQLNLVFCGGGGEQLMHLLARGGEFVPDLVFEGLAVMAALRPR